MASSRVERAALGFSPHTGWAAVVAVAGPPQAPSVVAKARVEMASTFEAGAVYHMGQRLPLDEAEALIRSSGRAFVEAARAAVEALATDLRARGFGPLAAAVPEGAARPLPPLAAILRSHALVHAAEGALYRGALVAACEACAIPAARVPARDLAARVAAAAGLGEDRVAAALAAMGAASGKPWARDQKDAALAAWLALGAPAAGRRAQAPRRL